MEPNPTPFDITAIPRFAFEPTLTTWIVALGIGGVFTLLLVLVRLLEGKRSSPEAALTSLRSRLVGLRARAATLDPRQCAEEISLLVRRYLAVRCGVNVPALTRTELLTWCSSLKNGAPAGEAPIAEIGKAVVALEELKYQSEAPEREAVLDCLDSIERASRELSGT